MKQTNKLVLIALLLFISIGNAQAESGNIVVEQLSTGSWYGGPGDAYGVANMSALVWDTANYNYISSVHFAITGATHQYEYTRGTIVAGGTGGVSGWYDAVAGNIYFASDSTATMTSSPLIISWEHNIWANVTMPTGSQDGDPSLTHPVGFKSTNAARSYWIATYYYTMSSRTTDSYNVTYPIIGGQQYFLLSVTKGLLQTKHIISNYTGIISTESSFNTTPYQYPAPYTNGLYLNVTLASGSFTKVLINDTVISTPSYTSAIITTNATNYFQNSILNYTVAYTNPISTNFYKVVLYKDINTYITNIAASDYIGTQGTRYYFIGAMSTGTYHIEVQDAATSVIRGISSDFTISAGFLPTSGDYITTTKTSYALGESQYIYGYASTITQIKLYSGSTLLGNMGTYTGNFSITQNRPTGNYLVAMERNVNGQISTITSVQYSVNNSPSLPISILMIDPGTPDCGYCYQSDTTDRKFAVGNTANGADGGQMITVQYNRKNSSDMIYIYSPDGELFTSWNVSTYSPLWLTSHEFYVPNQYTSIGIWTAKIVDGGNTSNFSTSTLKAFIYGNYVDNGVSNGNAVFQISDINPCSGTIVGISWNTTNLQAGYWVKLYKSDPFVMYFNQSYTSPTGTLSFKPMITSTAYQITISNLTEYQLINTATIITKSTSECANNATAIPVNTAPTTTDLNNTSMGLFMLFAQIAFYGLVVFMGGMFALVKAGIQGTALLTMAAFIATFEALAGLFGGYGIYVIIITWIILAVYFRFGRDMTTGGD